MQREQALRDRLRVYGQVQTETRGPTEVQLDTVVLQIQEIFEQPHYDLLPEEAGSLIRRLRAEQNLVATVIRRALTAYEFGSRTEDVQIAEDALEERRLMDDIVTWADTLMVMLDEHGPACVEHLLQSDNAGGQLKAALHSLNRFRRAQ